MTTLYDHLGRPVKTGDLQRELAGPTLAGIRTVWDQTTASGLTPYALAGLLAAAAAGDATAYLTLAEEMEERDLHYRCELGKRRLAVTRLEATVEAASDDPKDEELADQVRELARRDGFRFLCADLMDAIGKGYSVCEIMWDRAGQWWPDRYLWRDPRWFCFDRLARQEPRLLDEANSTDGLALAPYKFVAHVPRLKTGIPIRQGIARVAAWAWMCKNFAVKDWMAFAETYGMPLRLGKYGAGATSEDISVLKLAVANLGSDAAAVIPDSMMVEFIEAAKGSGAGNELFEKLADWLDKQVSRGILGQTATTEGTAGKLGNEDAQAEVREDIRDDDAWQLAATLNRDLVQPFIDLNWGPQQRYPQLQMRAPDQEDLTLLVSALEKLVPLGLKVEQSVIRDKFGLPEPEEGAEVLGPAVPAAPGAVEPEAVEPLSRKPAAAARPEEEAQELNSFKLNSSEQQGRFTPEQQALEDLADRAMAGVDLSANEARIVEAVQAAATWEEAIENLLALWPEMDMDTLTEMVERATVAAEMFGRAGQQPEED
ncbi:MAG: DUF935 domain-containing protein [Desulfobulbus sp.]|nr:DUF935 domain-containing protein [Desulfobulbus sp.]